MKISLIMTLLLAFGFGLQAQKVNDSNTPLHLMKPDYDTPYGKPELKSIVGVLDKIYFYLDQATPMELINKETQAGVTDYSSIDVKTTRQSDSQILS